MDSLKTGLAALALAPIAALNGVVFDVATVPGLTSPPPVIGSLLPPMSGTRSSSARARAQAATPGAADSVSPARSPGGPAIVPPARRRTTGPQAAPALHRADPSLGTVRPTARRVAPGVGTVRPVARGD